MSKAPFRIVFLDAATFGDVLFDRFTTAWDCTVHQLTQPAEVIKRIDGFPIVVTNKVALDRAILNAPEAANLKLIAEAATGTDNIDLAAARLLFGDGLGSAFWCLALFLFARRRGCWWWRNLEGWFSGWRGGGGGRLGGADGVADRREGRLLGLLVRVGGDGGRDGEGFRHVLF